MKKRLKELEEAVVDAWPVPEMVELDGFLLRATGGPSRRGNSVATLEPGKAMSVEERIAAAEAWYEARNQAPIFQVGPCVQPKDLDSVLEARGYGIAGAASFAEATPREVLARTTSAVRVTLSAKADRHFRDVVAKASRFSASMDAFLGILGRLGTRCRYATAFDAHDEPVASCVGIASEDRLGLYAMITRPEYRRIGAARALIRSLAERALHDEMASMYLLVDTENLAARALYAACGFTDVYAYHYRARPLSRLTLVQGS